MERGAGNGELTEGARGTGRAVGEDEGRRVGVCGHPATLGGLQDKSGAGGRAAPGPANAHLPEPLPSSFTVLAGPARMPKYYCDVSRTLLVRLLFARWCCSLTSPVFLAASTAMSSCELPLPRLRRPLPWPALATTCAAADPLSGACSLLAGLTTLLRVRRCGLCGLGQAAASRAASLASKARQADLASPCARLASPQGPQLGPQPPAERPRLLLL